MIHVKASSDGVNYNTEGFATLELPLKPGECVSATFPVDAFTMFVKVTVKNPSIKFSVRKWLLNPPNPLYKGVGGIFLIISISGQKLYAWDYMGSVIIAAESRCQS